MLWPCSSGPPVVKAGGHDSARSSARHARAIPACASSGSGGHRGRPGLSLRRTLRRDGLDAQRPGCWAHRGPHWRYPGVLPGRAAGVGCCRRPCGPARRRRPRKTCMSTTAAQEWRQQGLFEWQREALQRPPGARNAALAASGLAAGIAGFAGGRRRAGRHQRQHHRSCPGTPCGSRRHRGDPWHLSPLRFTKATLQEGQRWGRS